MQVRRNVRAVEMCPTQKFISGACDASFRLNCDPLSFTSDGFAWASEVHDRICVTLLYVWPDILAILIFGNRFFHSDDCIFQFWCRAMHIIVQYFMVANYFWMFCEGKYMMRDASQLFVSGEGS